MSPDYLVKRYSCHGFTYVELLITVVITSILVAGLMGVVSSTSGVGSDVTQRNELTREARLAMQRMLRTISHSRRLLLPLNDNPNTNWPEHIREQTIPASPPVGASTLATAVLAVTLPAYVDLNDDGIPDADNDGDGRIDEDHGDDMNNDYMPGIAGIDDDGDGSVDESNDTVSPEHDDDEEGDRDEDFTNGIDDDGDGNDGEDGTADMNQDLQSGLRGIDDDGDGTIDEDHQHDDDEDGNFDEDWLDSVVFYLDGNELIERIPVPWDVNFDFQVDGRDVIKSTLCDNVTLFRVQRIETATGSQLVDLALELTHPDSGETVSLQTRVRVGGAL